MEKIQFSIVMPVYNTNYNYLHEAIQSVIHQDYDKWELLIVDDGSTDESGTICDSYIATDSRIKILHQPNQGVSAARNKGISMASGDYVVFIDADDFFEINALSFLLKDLEKYPDIDVLIFSLCRIYDKTKIQIEPMYSNYMIYDTYEKNCDLQCDLLQAPLNKNILVFPYCKCIKRKLLLKFQPCFPVGVAMCEDVIFSFKLFTQTTKVVYTNRVLYNYRQTSQSAVNRFRQDAVNEQKILLEQLLIIIRFQNENAKLLNGYYYEVFYAMQRIIMTHYFHPDAPGSFWSRRKLCGKLFKENPYSKVFKHINLKRLPRNQKIKAFLIRFRLYSCMCQLRNLYFKLPWQQHSR